MLDDSGSMKGKRWDDLMKAFTIFLNKLLKDNNLKENSWITVINHDGRYIGWMDENSIDQNCNNSAVFKSNELEESHQTFDIAGTKENQNFTVFPNPASNEINIQINNNSDANYSFFISDLNGRRVLDISNLESKINKFDVSFLQSGLYIVHITEGETIEEFKIQIQR